MALLIIDDNSFDPIEVQYKGKKYVVKKVTNKLLMDLDGLENKVLEGDIDSLDKSIRIFVDIPAIVLKEMDFRDKTGIFTYVKSEMQDPEQYQKLIKKKTQNSSVSSLKPS